MKRNVLYLSLYLSVLVCTGQINIGVTGEMTAFTFPFEDRVGIMELRGRTNGGGGLTFEGFLNPKLAFRMQSTIGSATFIGRANLSDLRFNDPSDPLPVLGDIDFIFRQSSWNVLPSLNQTVLSRNRYSMMLGLGLIGQFIYKRDYPDSLEFTPDFDDMFYRDFIVGSTFILTNEFQLNDELKVTVCPVIGFYFQEVNGSPFNDIRPVYVGLSSSFLMDIRKAN